MYEPPSGAPSPALRAVNLKPSASVPARDGLRDFSADRRLLALAGMALFVGTAGAGAAWLLLRLINLVTNLAYFGRLSVATVSIADSTLGLASVLVPVGGCLIIGLMARYGSE
jgi:hypothetical protein